MENLMRAKSNLEQFEHLKSQCPDDARHRADLEAKIQTKKAEVDKAQESMEKLAGSTTASLTRWFRATAGRVLQGDGTSDGGSSGPGGVMDNNPLVGQGPAVKVGPSAAVIPGIAPNPPNNAVATASGPTMNGNTATTPAIAAITPTTTTSTTGTPISPATKNRKLKNGVAHDIQGLKINVENLINQLYNVEDNGNDRAQRLQEELDETKTRCEEELADLRKKCVLERRARQKDRTRSEERDAAQSAEIQALKVRLLESEQMMRMMQDSLKSFRDVTKRAKGPLGLVEKLEPIAGPGS
jgi:Skp family chaperone for outer membrane proteins